MHQAEAAADIPVVRQAAAHTQAAGHIPARQEAADNKVRHQDSICVHTAPDATPAGTPAAGRKRSVRAQQEPT
jgi:hypothetical protein